MMSDKEIQPPYVRLKLPESGSLIERIILSSSNCLRRQMGLQEGETLSGPVPKFVTRKNPSLDNYFADLLLRSCYEPIDYLPSYEEHVIYGSQDELPSRLNARLVGSILIGIGGRSSNPDFIKVYDEHSFHGTRTVASASQIVFEEHLDRYRDRPGVQSVALFLNEINSIDSEGGASFDHLYNILKSLNVAEFIHPGFVFEPLHPQWKRAVVEACLMSVCVGRDDFQRYDLEQATSDLEKEWDTYIAKIEKRIKYGFPDKIIPEAAQAIKQAILQPKEPTIAGQPSLITLKRILFAFRHFWHPSVSAYLLEFLFEAMRQGQQSFEEIRNTDVPLRRVHGNYAFVYYRKEAKDRLPHRGLMARINSQSIKALILVFDPAYETTAVFGSRHLPKKIWRRFVDSLLKKEGDTVWYVPTAADGSYANFILNGTEYYRGIPKTVLGEEDIFKLFSETVMVSASGNNSINPKG
jgi:hypothetical protein